MKTSMEAFNVGQKYQETHLAGKAISHIFVEHAAILLCFWVVCYSSSHSGVPVRLTAQDFVNCESGYCD